MMKRANSFSAFVLTLGVSLLFFAPLAAQQRSIEGRWEAERSRWNGERRVQINIRTHIDGERVRSGFSVRADKIEGDILTRSTSESTPVHFEIRREAGTFTFEGEQDGREAWGDFNWTGNTEYLQQMARRGHDDH